MWQPNRRAFLWPGAFGLTVAVALFAQASGSAQGVQKGADAKARGRDKLRIEYVGYRAARWETQHVTEVEEDRPNRGGLVSVYFTNVTQDPVHLAYWRCNGKDESYWRLGAHLAWDRAYDRDLAPGALGVLEINAVTEDFSAGRPFKFSYVDRSWAPAGRYETVLEEDPVQVSFIRVLPGMAEVEVHLRHSGAGTVEATSLSVVGHGARAVRWVGAKMHGPSRAIGRIALDRPLAPAELLVVKVGVTGKDGPRTIFAHRRAFEDWFPIGVWSNKPETYALLRRHHIETVVRGGRAEDEFYAEIAPKYGFRTMAPCGKPVDVDTVRSLGEHPAVACWMLADEPDWSIQADVMLFVDQTVRRYNTTKPTFITLCRNVKFFEYAPIPDIPCMDHYAVTAPSSSRWPKFYGTRLEETAFYTRDLKAASEPKPIWIWSQGIASWSQRPKRPVPTPAELAAQLMLNLGRGAKGILWFNYDHNVAEKYPDTREAMRLWGRVLRLTRDDFLSSEPYVGGVDAPDKIDVAPLVSWDRALLCVTNLDYEIDAEAYPFRTKEDVRVSVRLPEWIRPEAALLVAPDGVSPLPFKTTRKGAELALGDLEVCKLVVLCNDIAAEGAYRQLYARVLEDEHRAS